MSLFVFMIDLYFKITHLSIKTKPRIFKNFIPWLYTGVGIYYYSVKFFISLSSFGFFSLIHSLSKFLLSYDNCFLCIGILRDHDRVGYTPPQTLPSSEVFCMKCNYLDIYSSYQHIRNDCLRMLMQTTLKPKGVSLLHLVYHVFIYCFSELLLNHWIQVHKKKKIHQR